MQRTNLLFGIIGWIIFTALLVADGWDTIDWVIILFLSAPLIWIPMTITWLPMVPELVRLAQFPSAALLGMSYMVTGHSFAAWLALPWLVLSGYWAIVSLLAFWKQQRWDDLLLYLAPGALTVGAGWAFIDRMGFQPLGFDPVIILLTAVHFHFMGFLLLINFWKLTAYRKIAFAKIAQWILLLGIALTATGISVSQLGGSALPEIAGVVLTVGPAFWLGMQYTNLGWKTKHPWSRGSWILGGCCLMGGMVLALLYGLRFWIPMSFLTIPFMYQLHGTLNVLGVGSLFTLGWASHPEK